MPKKLEKCVQHLKDQGKDDSSAWAICTKSTGYKRKKGGGWIKEETLLENNSIFKIIVKHLGNIILDSIWEIWKEMSKKDQITLSTGFLSWVLSIFQNEIELSPQEQKKIKKDMKELESKIISGEKMVLEILGRDLMAAEKRGDKKAVKRILTKAKKYMTKWENTNALDYIPENNQKNTFLNMFLKKCNEI